jgi:60 kDa SS-A/Ro ribonucleoprotein
MSTMSHRTSTQTDDWTRLRRFLVLGSEAASYHASASASAGAAERVPSRTDAPALERCIRTDGPRAVAEIVRMSATKAAAGDDPALFALAMAAGLGDDATRRAALDALPRVARTGAQLCRFAAFVEDFRGWGRSLRRAVGRWYATRPVDALAREAVAQRATAGVAHRDLLRLAHPGARVSAGNPSSAVSTDHARLFDWMVRGGSTDGLPRTVEGFARARTAPTPAATARLVADYGLPREAVRPEHLNAPDVWAALLAQMPLETLLHSLAKMTRVGVLAPGSAGTAAVVAQLTDAERVRDAGVQPIEVLAALRAYAAGRGVRGRTRWAAVADVVDALDAAFHTAIANVTPTGGRVLLAVDVSVSMAWGHLAGAPGLSPRDAAAAIALVTAATEPRHEIVGFFPGSWFRDRGRHRYAGLSDGLARLPIAPGHRLDDAIRILDGHPFGTTDCALPVMYAQALEREIDTFVVLTDADTRPGDVHPAVALRDYRAASGIDARLVVVGMAAHDFSIADPDDGGMLDVVGFDPATPRVIADFARRAI